MPVIWPRRRFRSPITSPEYSSGVTTSTFMIGSSSTGFALAKPSLKAIEPAILNAISLESTSWYEPSVSATFTSTIGKPAITPLPSCSLMPLSTAGMYSRGIDAADDLVDELVALALLERLEADPDVAVLAAAAGLAHELAFLLDATCGCVSR